MESKKIQVIKRDGSLQDFEKEKIIRVAKTAGLDEEQANEVGEIVEEKVTQTGKDKISTKHIRYWVLNELRERDKYAANLYEWYDKRKHRDHGKN